MLILFTLRNVNANVESALMLLKMAHHIITPEINAGFQVVEMKTITRKCLTCGETIEFEISEHLAKRVNFQDAEMRCHK
jgi:hypothetical protein